MKRYTVKVLCRGCKGEIVVSFDAKGGFKMASIPKICPHCESDLLILAKHGMFKRELQTLVRLIKHSDKLSQLLLKEGQTDA